MHITLAIQRHVYLYIEFHIVSNDCNFESFFSTVVVNSYTGDSDRVH